MQAYTQDMNNLNYLTPDVQPCATQTINEIIALVSKLIKEGYAYEVDGDVYFRVRAFKDYGKLSKRKLDDLQAGARVEVNDKKKKIRSILLCGKLRPKILFGRVHGGMDVLVGTLNVLQWRLHI